ncbi:uncharacterized protein VICG_01391 [Vittaforma corneae ATCC 50505]|uniref:guanosine-diphosphatase n=1 Tax=Vittaforma corneae (strain ATCC 50505) TaxID=993615 RepID=L2GMJ5_VITCO|nr:uncharacterized protein VICG_01391 [Vittaforma corneae ATCC 50505]ELA41527.1 hypothetical protein VICG_01391 [Vittaforma corneae ATCC 50505]
MSLLFPVVLLVLWTANCINIGIFDAGSTGTRLKIYQFDGNTLTSQLTFKHHELNKNIPKKGIHEQSNSEIESTIDELVRKAIEIQPDMLLAFYGTAGMRSVPANIQNSILDRVRDCLKKYNLFDVKVLEGNEEALYSLKSFEHYLPWEDDFSIVDMGGRSVQIIHKRGSLIRVNSLEMGIINSTCKQQNNKVKSIIDGLLKGRSDNLLTEVESSNQHSGKRLNSEILIKGTDCREIKEKGIKVYECEEKSIFNSFIDRKNAKVKSNESTANKIDNFHHFRIITKFNNKDQINNKSFLASSDLTKSQDNSNIECIDSFFDMSHLEKQSPTKKVFLLSFYEEILTSTKNITLKRLFENYNSFCSKNSDEKCTKLYYSLKFLEKLGINESVELILVNKLYNIDISWSLGIALEIKRMNEDALSNNGVDRLKLNT